MFWLRLLPRLVTARCLKLPPSTNAFAFSRHKSTLSSRSAVWAGIFTLSASLALLPTAYLDSDSSHDEETVVDPATSIAFPKILNIPSTIPLPTYTLLGLGVRTVSFLGIKVYSVGFYADLGDPRLNIPVTATPEEKIDHIIRNTSCVIRIIPTRSTSYTHLRDGFMRALHARMRRARQDGQFTHSDEMSVQTPMLTLKSIFPNAPLQKHTPLDVILSPPSSDKSTQRVLLFRDLGGLKSDWVATEFMLAYFQDKPPSSALKKSVTENLESFGS